MTGSHVGLGLAALTILLTSGCVTRSEHEAAMDDAARRLQAAQQQATHQVAGANAQIVSLQNQLVKLESEIAQRDGRIDDVSQKLAALQHKLDNATALSQKLSEELSKSGKNVGKLLAEQGHLSSALASTKERLEELRKAQAAAQKRANLFRDLLLKFKRMIDAGDLKIVLRDGRMVLQLRNDVLFDSGKVAVKKEGEDALREVAGVLLTLDDRKLQVAGHTDDDPISTARFPSNWELSTARAVAVVKFLTEEGVKESLLSAAGYGEHDGVANNDTPDGKAKNRRIEIVLQPNIAELVSVPDVP